MSGEGHSGLPCAFLPPAASASAFFVEANSSDEVTGYVAPALNKAYVSIEVTCALVSIVGNLLVILAFARFRVLRTITNYYVISLAVADLLVGLLGIPSAIANSVGLPRNFYACLLFNSVLLFLCTGSIFSLLAVSVDRFWSIMWPLTYPLHMTKRNTLCVILISWLLAAIIGLLPLMGWNRGVPPEPRCIFLEVMEPSYLLFIHFATIVTPTLIMAALYFSIYMIVRKQVKRLSVQSQRKGGCSHGIQRHTSNAHLISDSKAARNLAIIVSLFVISWLPLYTINTVLYFYPNLVIPGPLMLTLIALSHFNSAWNPALYAWGLRHFRSGLLRLTRLGKWRAGYASSDSMVQRYYANQYERPSIVSLQGSVVHRCRDISPTLRSSIDRRGSCRVCYHRTRVGSVQRYSPPYDARRAVDDRSLKADIASDCVNTILATTGL